MRRLSLKSTLFGVDPNNRGLPQENETDTTNGLRLSKLRKLQIEGLGSMRRLSLKSTLFGVDPTFGIDPNKKAAFSSGLKPSGVPTGIRTPVLGMKIQCPDRARR